MLKAVNNLLRHFATTFKLLGKGKAWLFALIIFVVHFFFLTAFDRFYEPFFYSLVTFITGLINPKFANAFTHFPGHYQLMGVYFYKVKFFMGIFFEGALLGAIAIYFYNYISEYKNKAKKPFTYYLNNWLQLNLAWLVINGLIYLLGKYLPVMLEGFLQYSPRRQFVFDYLFMPGLNIIITAFFYVIIAYVIIYQTNIFNAAYRSLIIFLNNPISIFIKSFVVLIVPILLSYVIGAQDTLVTKFNPEIVYWILLTGLIIDIPVNIFWMGSSVLTLSELE